MIPSLFYVLALALTQLTGGEVCQDCNRPVDDGCRCVCYSGCTPEDCPDDPACQF